MVLLYTGVNLTKEPIIFIVLEKLILLYKNMKYINIESMYDIK